MNPGFKRRRGAAFNVPKGKSAKINSTKNPNHNRFDVLSTDDEYETMDEVPLIEMAQAKQRRAKSTKRSNGDTQPKKKTTTTTAPIVITDDKRTEDGVFTGWLTAAALEGEYYRKHTGMGIKVSFAKTTDYVKFAKVLVDNNVEHFSYRSKEDKTFKAVMAGLPKMDSLIVKTELKQSYNIDALSIVDMNTKNQSQYGLYLIEFCCEINLKTLQNVKYIDHTVINWRRYTPRPNGPTQCRRCGLYGHGQTNCNRKMVCIACAGDHGVSECPYKDKENAVVFKCFNCVANKKKSDHRADDPRCPSRNEYLAIRQRITEKNSRSSARNTPQMQPAPKPATASVPKQSSAPRTQVSYADICSGANNGNQDLFSVDELFDIFCQHLEQINKCRTKMDQMKVIVSLLKHGIK